MAAVGLVLRASIAGAVLALFGLARGGGTAGADDSPTLSADEGVLALLPFHLTPDDAPPGYREVIGGESLATPATVALTGTQPGEDPFPLLDRRLASGLIVQVGWSLFPDNSTAPRFRYSAALYRDDDSAAAYARGEVFPVEETPAVSVEQLPPPTAGESGVTYRSIDLDANAAQRNGMQVRWQRGRIVFQLDADWGEHDVPPGDVLRPVEHIDARLAERSTPVVAAPTFLLVAGERERLYALLRLQTAAPPPEGAPDGYRATRPLILPSARDALQSNDPASAVHRNAVTFRRVIGTSQNFLAGSGISGPSINVRLLLAADMEAARRNLTEYPPPLGIQSDSGGTRYIDLDVVQMEPPVMVGDAMRAWRSSWELSPLVNHTMAWTHGPLLLVVSVGSRAEDLDPDTARQILADAARWVEASYQMSAFTAPETARSRRLPIVSILATG